MRGATRGADAVRNTRDDRRLPAGGLRDARRPANTPATSSGSWGSPSSSPGSSRWSSRPISASRCCPRSNRSKAVTTRSTTRRTIGLRRLITFAVRHKFVTCGIVGIAFALSVVGMGALKQQFFPTSDRPKCWWRFACRKAPASRRRPPRSRSSNAGWTASPRPRSSRAMSVRALPASSSRWRRNCLILPSPRSSC